MSPESKVFTGALSYFILACVALVIWAPTLFFGFVYLDDSKFLINNASFLGNFSNFFELFRHDVYYPSDISIYYRPLQNVLFMFGDVLGQGKPWSHHFLNILFHSANVILVYIFFKLLGVERRLSFFAALIFAIHPLNAGAVAWIPGNIELLVACFMLVAFISFIQFLRRSGIWWYTLHAASFMAALLTKELAIILILVIPTLALLVERQWKKFSTIIPAWIGCVTFWILIRSKVIRGSTATLARYSLVQVIHNVSGILVYLGKMLFPFNLSVLPIQDTATIALGLASVLIVLALLFFTKKTRINAALFACVWLFLFLLPSLAADDPSTKPIFMEHRAYIPLIGFLLLITQTNFIHDNSGKKLFMWSVIAVSVLLSLLSILHEFHWQSRLVFWKQAAQSSPGLPKAHGGLGSTYFAEHMTREAEKEYRQAIALGPNEKSLHNNLGTLLMETGHGKEAEGEFLKELEINPLGADTSLNLAVLYYVYLKEAGRAKEFFDKTIALNPNMLKAYEYRAIYYYEHEHNPEKMAADIEAVTSRGGKVQTVLINLYEDYRRKNSK